MSLDRDLAALKRIPLLASLENEALRLLAFSGESRILRTGDTLFRRGDLSDGGFVLLDGALEVLGDSADSGRKLSPPTLVGEIALISEIERSATVMAIAPSSVLKISRALFHRVLAEQPASARRVKTFLERRLREYARELDAASRGAADPAAPAAS